MQRGCTLTACCSAQHQHQAYPFTQIGLQKENGLPEVFSTFPDIFRKGYCGKGHEVGNQHSGPFSSCSTGHASSHKLSTPSSATVQPSLIVIHCVSLDALIHRLMQGMLHYATGSS